MFLFAVMLVLITRTSGAVQTPSYQHEDPVTGDKLTCNRCPAGFHMSAHCTATEQTVCMRCAPLHFTQYWNYLSKCLYCATFCGENQIIKEECSALNDRVCECKKGYYWHAEFCLRHTECPSGHGVKRNGTVHLNTECERCPRGTFSAISSSRAPCVNHTDCASHGLRVVLRGTGLNDNRCAPCKELKEAGAPALLRKLIADFFAHERIRLGKVKRFVRKHMGGDEWKQPGDVTLQIQRQLVLNRIKEWAEKAGEKKLREFPDLMRKSQLHNAADKLQKKIQELEDALNCDL